MTTSHTADGASSEFRPGPGKNAGDADRTALHAHEDAEHGRSRRHFDAEVLIVGIGASAGGLEALQKLLRALPSAHGLALVVIQHLSAQHDSALVELLARETSLRVVSAQHDMQIEAGHVYVIPPNSLMTVEQGLVSLVTRPSDHEPFHPIDAFFSSLAAHARSDAIGVILSGTGHDGVMGVRAIKEAGGVVLVQLPSTAKYDGMPRAASATGMVDRELRLEELARELARLSNPPAQSAHETSAGAAQVDERFLPRIFVLLREACGVDFAHYKLPTIKRRLQRRLLLHRLENVEDYVSMLERDREEVLAFYRDLLIHVTRFFREPDSFVALAHDFFPRILEALPSGAPVRMWVPGCATGEEVYSLAIAWLEFLGSRGDTVTTQIFATDVSEESIDRARAGSYPESISADVSPERLSLFFSRTDGGFRINRDVRDLCVFARHDLTQHAPFSKLDLILCRNVLIYLGPRLQRHLMSVFHYALKPEGILVVGRAESAGAQPRLFAIAQKQHRIYRRRDGPAPRSEHLPVAPVLKRAEPAVSLLSKPGRARGVEGELARRLIERFGPPGVVVDPDLQIIQFLGQVAPFVAPGPGDASLHLYKMTREHLLLPVKSAVHEAIASLAPVRREGLPVETEGRSLSVDLEVIPLILPEGRHLLIVFLERYLEPEARGVTGPPTRDQNQNQELERMRRELEASRGYLQAIISDLESSNENLQSANEEIVSSSEELQSTNEELRSTNEELDTAKEELQSTNEELNTINEELQQRNEELALANSDLTNLLASVQIAIVIVDADARIRRFTPMAERLLNLIPSDVGRPIGHIKPEIECPDLDRPVRQVLASLAPVEIEVPDAQGNHFSLRVSPYKDAKNRLSGAVIAVFDITASKHAEARMRRARDFERSIVEAVREPLLVLNGEFEVRAANPAFLRCFELTAEETLHRKLWQLGGGRWDNPRLRRMLHNVLEKDEGFDDFVFENEFEHLGRLKLHISARKIPEQGEEQVLILLAIEDANAPSTTAAERTTPRRKPRKHGEA